MFELFIHSLHRLLLLCLISFSAFASEPNKEQINFTEHYAESIQRTLEKLKLDGFHVRSVSFSEPVTVGNHGVCIATVHFENPDYRPLKFQVSVTFNGEPYKPGMWQHNFITKFHQNAMSMSLFLGSSDIGLNDVIKNIEKDTKKQLAKLEAKLTAKVGPGYHITEVRASQGSMLRNMLSHLGVIFLTEPGTLSKTRFDLSIPPGPATQDQLEERRRALSSFLASRELGIRALETRHQEVNTTLKAKDMLLKEIQDYREHTAKIAFTLQLLEDYAKSLEGKGLAPNERTLADGKLLRENISTLKGILRSIELARTITGDPYSDKAQSFRKFILQTYMGMLRMHAQGLPMIHDGLKIGAGADVFEMISKLEELKAIKSPANLEKPMREFLDLNHEVTRRLHLSLNYLEIDLREAERGRAGGVVDPKLEIATNALKLEIEVLKSQLAEALKIETHARNHLRFRK